MPAEIAARTCVALEDAVDDASAGAKAARLARARAAGLPVLPGIVVPAEAAAPALAAGLRAHAGGSGAAQLAVMDWPFDAALSAALAEHALALGSHLVVRSSSPLEGDGRWSGAFASYVGVAPEHLDVAVRGVWASAFSRDVLDRMAHQRLDLANLRVAVLVQPARGFAFGGVARLEGAGNVRIEGARGGPAGILSGWVVGEEIDPAITREVTELVRRTHVLLGYDAIEWGSNAEGIVLLQAQRGSAHGTGTRLEPDPVLGVPEPAEAVIAGVGRGVGRYLEFPQEGGALPPGSVLIVARPLAAFAPLLWNAAGLVCRAGGAGAHLIEVARSLDVPTVMRCRLDDVVAAGAENFVLTVDGDEGCVFVHGVPARSG
ncbi:MAG: hypothetical protein JOY59_08935 [Candidatus Eremiobacteraeota bacterium]|nr:hypothetical protein [Candidatus Eremiobacteraeota bacterium]